MNFTRAITSNDLILVYANSELGYCFVSLHNYLMSIHTQHRNWAYCNLKL